LSRAGAGIVACGNGSQGNTSCSLELTNIGIGANLLIAGTAPTISTHFNTSGDSIAANGAGAFAITVGTGTATSTGAITLPAATTGWVCVLTNQNRADVIQQTGNT